MGVAIGIDLGTSNSCVAVMHEGRPAVLLDHEGNATQPSVVAFGYGDHVVVGRRARRQLLHAPENTIIAVKRLLGGRYHSADIQRLKLNAAYGIIEGEDDSVRVRVQGRIYTPEEISAHILAHVKTIAENALGEKVDRAVVCVPAYFNDNQRQATRDAATIAGIECLRIMNEPTAAALAYGYGEGRRQHVVVYDLGGGTFDVSVLRIDDDFFEVIATAGDTFLGGEDFDDFAADHFLKQLEQQVGVSFTHNRNVRMRMRDAAERAKIVLTDAEEVEVHVPTAWREPNGHEHSFETRLNRYTYATWMMPFVRRTIEVCELALRNAGLSIRQVDAVLLVGGMTRYPLIREAVQQFFGRVPNTSLNPDEVVAIGAAIEAHVLTNETVSNPTVLLDVTPRTLSVRTVGGLCEPVITCNSPIPTEASRSFHTAVDEQTEVRVAVYQGESRRIAENTLLGEFVLDELPPMPRGKLRVRITFEINADGILEVRAVDDQVSRERSIRIEGSVGMNADAIAAARERALVEGAGERGGIVAE